LTRLRRSDTVVCGNEKTRESTTSPGPAERDTQKNPATQS